MAEQTVEQQLHEIVSRFRGESSGRQTILTAVVLDYNKTNSHESKSEFLAEKAAVEKALDAASTVLDFVSSGYDDEIEKNHRDMFLRTTSEIDDGVRDRLKEMRVESAADLVRKSSAEVSTTLIAAFLMIDLDIELRKRKQELEDQEREFWSGSSRPPNHYARTMALRLARIVAQETGKKPTIGTSRDGNHPSTDFGRALEDVFKVLGIKSSFRRAGKWAIEQLTDNDLRRPQNALAGLANFGFGVGGQPRNALLTAMEGLPKG